MIGKYQLTMADIQAAARKLKRDQERGVKPEPVKLTAWAMTQTLEPQHVVLTREEYSRVMEILAMITCGITVTEETREIISKAYEFEEYMEEKWKRHYEDPEPWGDDK